MSKFERDLATVYDVAQYEPEYYLSIRLRSLLESLDGMPNNRVFLSMRRIAFAYLSCLLYLALISSEISLPV